MRCVNAYTKPTTLRDLRGNDDLAFHLAVAHPAEIRTLELVRASLRGGQCNRGRLGFLEGYFLDTEFLALETMFGVQAV